MSYYERIAREVKNAKDYFLNWPANEPVKLGDYGFYNGRRVSFDWQGNLSSFGVNLAPLSENLPMSQSTRSGGSVDVKFDLRSSTPASARLAFRKKHCVSFESHGGVIEKVEMDLLFKAILERIGIGELTWNPHWVVVTQIYKVDSFSSFVSGSKSAGAEVVASTCARTTPFSLADPSGGLSIGNQCQMAHCSVAERGALPFFVIGKVKGEKDGSLRMERYGLGER